MAFRPIPEQQDSEWLDELPPVGWTGLCNNYFYQIDRRQKGQVVHITRTGARVIEFENGDVNTCTAPNDFIIIQSERER